ncbi:MAG: Adaptive-response sensory-kinase SasA [Bryobacteraceae bacterium]|nr:Adaptive-response sensory-kinase SasA [Bryobacteraceae bacterium]
MRALLQKIGFVRGLRFRLTLTNGVFLIGLLVAMGFFFRGILSRILDNQVRDVLNEEWGAVKGYLVIHKRKPDWRYDREDEEEAFIVQRLQRVFLLADAKGSIITSSQLYDDFGVISREEILKALASREPFWVLRTASDGEQFQIRGGAFVDDNDQTYFVAIGRTLGYNETTLNQFTKDYFLLLPLLILSGSLLGWFVAGRALRPVNELAQTAERITGANLNLRIPPRHSGDELDHLISTFNKMVERLENSFIMTRQFNTDVSHELRTPLTAIRGQLEVALFTATRTEQYREAMINALEDVDRLSQTVKAMLLLSQAESGQLALQRSSLDFSAVVEDIVDQFQIPAEAAELQLSCDLPGPARVEADRVQIERMISNLLSNAVKYTPKGGSVTARVRANGSTVVFEVEDTGVGIPPNHLPHIFDRLYRVPGSSKDVQGLGLGLSFVAWIVKAHGGSIDVDSRPGSGTRFTITLPVAPSPAGAAAPPLIETASTPSTPAAQT